MRALARYAQANAVVRANLSALLAQPDYEPLIRAESPSTAWPALTETSYADLLPEHLPANPIAIDRCLRDATVQRFHHVLRPLSGPPRAVALALLSRWDLDDLEDALRIWHAKDTHIPALVPTASRVHPIPFEALVGSDTLEDLAALLESTPYADPIHQAVPLYRESRSLFRIEVALEKGHYQRLLAEVSRLSKSDAEAVRHIIGSEIDLLNLAWLSRCASYHEIEPALLRDLMIPNPSPLTRRLYEAASSPDSLLSVAGEIIQRQLGGEAERQPDLDRLALLESLIIQSVAENAVASLAGFPFRFTSFLAFYFLLRVELRNLRMLFAGKLTGLEPDELSSRLWIVR